MKRGPIQAMRLHRCGEALRREALTLPDPAPDQVLDRLRRGLVTGAAVLLPD